MGFNRQNGGRNSDTNNNNNGEGTSNNTTSNNDSNNNNNNIVSKPRRSASIGSNAGFYYGGSSSAANSPVPAPDGTTSKGGGGARGGVGPNNSSSSSTANANHSTTSTTTNHLTTNVAIATSSPSPSASPSPSPIPTPIPTTASGLAGGAPPPPSMIIPISVNRNRSQDPTANLQALPEVVQRRLASMLRMQVIGSVRTRVEAGHLDFINEIRPLTCMFLGFPSLLDPPPETEEVQVEEEVEVVEVEEVEVVHEVEIEEEVDEEYMEEEGEEEGEENEKEKEKEEKEEESNCKREVEDEPFTLSSSASHPSAVVTFADFQRVNGSSGGGGNNNGSSGGKNNNGSSGGGDNNDGDSISDDDYASFHPIFRIHSSPLKDEVDEGNVEGGGDVDETEKTKENEERKDRQEQDSNDEKEALATNNTNTTSTSINANTLTPTVSTSMHGGKKIRKVRRIRKERRVTKQMVPRKRIQKQLVTIIRPKPLPSHQAQVDSVQFAFTSVQRIMRQWDGSFLQFRCDEKGYVGICAFGLPGHTHEDNPTRGVLAALDLQKLIKAGGHRVAIGVTTGDLLCTCVGARKLRSEYTVFGDAINLSARLMVKSKKDPALGDVLCDDVTHSHAKFKATFDELAPLTVKGKAAPVQVYNVTPHDSNTASQRAKEEVRAEMMNSAERPLIGRDGEITELLTKAANMISGMEGGGVTVVEGNTGMGKTKFILEVRKSLERICTETTLPGSLPAFHLLFSMADTANKSQKLHPWKRIFHELFRIDQNRGHRGKGLLLGGGGGGGGGGEKGEERDKGGRRKQEKE